MSQQITHKELSAYVDELGSGFLSGFRFPGQLEREFRKYYSKLGVFRARLMPCFVLLMSVITAFMFLSGKLMWDPLSIVYNFALLVPLILATLYFSTLPDRYSLYQKLLATTGLTSGLFVESMFFGPSMEGMPSYFSMEVTWILATWLVLGLRFIPATAVAMILSVTHAAGIIFLDYPIQVVGYQIGMLALVNGIGSMCCYQLEITTRRSFLESRELAELTKELKALAEIDSLTGLNNRRTYDAYIDRLWRQAKRDQTPLTFILIDIDHFKDYNDHYGHQAGDDALAAVANVIGSQANRPFDFAARYGGEEFVLVLHNSDDYFDSNKEEEFANACAESVRRNVVKMQIPHELSTCHRYVTVSIGVAFIMPETNRSLSGSLQMADEALYQAKDEGRNRVVVKADVPAFRTGNFREARKRA